MTPSVFSLSDGTTLHPFVLTIGSASDIAAMITMSILHATLNKLDAFLAGGKITQAAHDTLVAEIDALLLSLT